eukprot:9643463-Ditylum_brightwellii.AAC.1
MQTALLVDETVGSVLSKTIAYLEEGDKVELEWLQIRVEYDTPINEQRFRIIQQCQKLAKLEADVENALIDQYPQPQIMIRKDQMCGPGPGEVAKETKTGGKTKQEKTKKRKGKKGKRRG